MKLFYKEWRNKTGLERKYIRALEDAFEFLLERESNNSILSQFDLKVISSYFPEYEKEIKKRLKA